MIVPLLPQRIIALTGSLKTVGYLASAFAVPFVLLQFPIGRLSDRYGFRRFLLMGYLICSISGLLYCFPKTQELIFFGRLLQGLGEAPLWSLAPALLTTLYPEAKGKVIGFYNASFHIGLTLGGAFGILISGYWVENEPFLLFTILSILAALLILVGVKEPELSTSAFDDATDTKELKKLFKSPVTLAVFSGILLYGAGYGISLTVLPSFLIQNKGFTPGRNRMFFYVLLYWHQPVSDNYRPHI